MFDQAVKSKAWKATVQSEIDSIEKNKTWVLTDLPTGHKAIDLKWVFKEKNDTNGETIKYKARLVTKGYVQRYGIDFEKLFAPVIRLETIRLLLTLATKKNWEIHHLDVKSAFLNGELMEEVYVSQPMGYVKAGQEMKVYRLLKASYGLRQAPRALYAQLNKCLPRLGFTKCPFEHVVYTRRNGDESLIFGVYVDDLLITGTSVSHIFSFKEQMSSEFICQTWVSCHTALAWKWISATDTLNLSKLLMRRNYLRTQEWVIAIQSNTQWSIRCNCTRTREENL